MSHTEVAGTLREINKARPSAPADAIKVRDGWKEELHTAWSSLSPSTVGAGMPNDGRVASVWLSGDELDPSEVSQALDTQPRAAWRKGDMIPGADGSFVPAETGSWVLGVDEPRWDLDGQVVELLSRMTDDLDVWRDLAARYDCKLSCGVFMAELTEELSFQRETLAMVAARGLPMHFDVFGPLDQD